MFPVKKTQTWLPSIFNDLLGNEWISKPNESAPQMNIMECDKGYRVEIATPGMTKEDFTIEVKHENHLVVTMEKKCCCAGKEANEENCKCDEQKSETSSKPEETKDCGCTWESHEEEALKEGKFLRREFSYSQFRQTLILPDNIDKNKITAKQENGVLTIYIPKKDSVIEAQASKKIDIQ